VSKTLAQTTQKLWVRRLRCLIQSSQVSNSRLYFCNEWWIWHVLVLEITNIAYLLSPLFKNQREEVSTEKWNVLHMYALDSDLETARSGFINYGQERLELAYHKSPFLWKLAVNKSNGICLNLSGTYVTRSIITVTSIQLCNGLRVDKNKQI